MASKLYPPLLEASIPAFIGGTSGAKVEIPFKHNPLVAQGDFKSFKVQVKKVSGELVKVYDGTLDNSNNNIITCTLKYSDMFANPTDSLKKQANWYKFSIAYVSTSGEVGYYSTVAVGRYLGNINLKLTLSVGMNKVVATYEHEGDPAEKAYSYRFILTKNETEIIEDTGIQLHNINEDSSAIQSTDTFMLRYHIAQKTNDIYKIKYSLTTINGKVLEDEKRINEINLSGVALTSINEKEMFTLKAECNRNNATVDIWAIPNTNESSITGWFKVWRSCSKDNYKFIREVAKFALVRTATRDGNGYPYKLLLASDKTVEAGYYYKYFIQKYNKYGIVSEVISIMPDGPVYVSYDDCFLWDGERQLRIKFNPKISSFKTNILQSKSETIGSKYPFIMRNGVVNYKEFPISGLISFLMDENELFMTKQEKEQLGILPENTYRNISPGSTHVEVSGGLDSKNGSPQRHLRKNLERGTPQNLVDININGEKEFKLKVLDFLNNNKPKLFRSATEGIYVVYTMNSSLTPNDTLGRMLHTFNCTAYECGDVEEFCDKHIYNQLEIYNNETEYVNILNISDLNEKCYQKMRHIPYLPTAVKDDDEAIFDTIIDQRLLDIDEYARNFFIRDAKPLQQFKIKFVDLFNPNNQINPQIITIGSTGSYNYFCTQQNHFIKNIMPLLDKNDLGLKFPGTITFRDVISIPVTDFDFLYETGNQTRLAETVLLKEQSKYITSWYESSSKFIYGYNEPYKNEILYNLISDFEKIKPHSLFESSFFDGNTFRRREILINDIKLLRVFNTDPVNAHQAVYTLGKGFKIYEELARIFTGNKSQKINRNIGLIMKEMKGEHNERLNTQLSNFNSLNDYKETYQVSKYFYQFCYDLGIGRLQTANAKIGDNNCIFVFKEMEIEDRVKYMTKSGHQYHFPHYDVWLDFESINNSATVEDFFKKIQNSLINMLTAIKRQKTERLIIPNGHMTLAAETPNVFDFCIWADSDKNYNKNLIYEISYTKQQNKYNFGEIQAYWNDNYKKEDIVNDI